jgi:hypothetical protein
MNILSLSPVFAFLYPHKAAIVCAEDNCLYKPKFRMKTTQLVVFLYVLHQLVLQQIDTQLALPSCKVQRGGA